MCNIMSYHLIPSILKQIISDDFFLELNDNIPDKSVINNSLQKYLLNAKQEITKCTPQWDIYKKYTNPYEYIHTIIPGSRNAICKYKPLSRSYFKMIEIVKSLYILDILPDDRITTFHLAEGPGGFIEAICNIRDNSDDVYYGMTLISDKEYVPGWRKSQEYLDCNINIKLEYGIDGTGNILSPENLKSCHEKYHNSMDLVTGDGGFDFSINFDEQESSASRLIFAQIMYAILLQKQNGVFILKLFDAFTSITIDYIYLLSSFYEKVYIIKPNTSRYANSERYVVCKGFKYKDTSNLYDTFHEILCKINTNPTKYMQRILKIEIPYLFLSKLEEFNAIIGQQQLENINTTLDMVRVSTSIEQIDHIKRSNQNRCIQWCIKNKQTYNRGGISGNIFLSN